MSSGGAPLYPFPEELLRIPRRASATIEASAGTGKTYLLEHLIVDRLLRGDARLEEMLVVTFTEKAAAELVRRVRAKIDELLAFRDTPPGASPDACWRLDTDARARLSEARHAFDRATITTIHGFCQRVLTETPFASRRLLVQRHVDSSEAFAQAFTEALRTRFSVDPRLRRYLRAWQASGKTIDKLRKDLYAARVLRRPLGTPYDEQRLRDAVTTFAEVTWDFRLKDQVKRRSNGGTANAIERRWQKLVALCQRFLQHDDPATFLRELDAEIDGSTSKDLFIYLDEKLPPPPHPFPELARFVDTFLGVADAAPPLPLAVCALFLPEITPLLEARKRSAGLFDFDDMIGLVAEGLRGPDGPALAETLRARYRLAIIDEFQDTDADQWEIFRRLFADSDGASPLYVVGDPKQSIYGFRGADLPTYERARRELGGGDAPTVRLGRNFRSTAAVVDAYNAILDPEADPPFFDDRALYPEPAVAADVRAAAAGADPPATPVVLLSVRPAAAAVEITRLPLRQVRHALTRAIAAEIRALRAGPRPPALHELFVLTRTNGETLQIAGALRDAGIPHVLYNQERLYQTEEARDVLDVLAAIEEPRDPARRIRAWLTPFFGLDLGDMAGAVGLPAGHPLEEKLHAWRARAEARDWGGLFDRILDDSGVAARELLVGRSARRLTNYVHLFELLLAHGARAAASLGDLVRHLSALTEGLTVPPAEEGNVQRIEGDRDAVQIMTMHKAKGLEADHVFLYGAFTPWRGVGVKAYARGGERLLHAGRARRAEIDGALRREADGEDQRLLYVALTRARRRLYLPFAGTQSEGVERPPGREEVYWRVGGAYRHVHRRLRLLREQEDPRLRAEERPVPCPAPPDEGELAAAAAAGALHGFRPAAAELAWTFPADELAERRRRHAGIVVTSYTRMSEARAAAEPPTEVLDEVPGLVDDGGHGDDGGDEALVQAPPAATTGGESGDGAAGLPGGAAWGIFLHALLEAAPLDGLTGDGAEAEAWAARPDIGALTEAAMRRHDRDARHRPEVERMVHAALTTPFGPELPGLCGMDRVAREVEFLFPFPDAAGGGDRGFIKGYIDVVFAHHGRAYFGDWKSDLLPSYAPDAVAAHVATHYELQRRLYALALARMLGIADRADHEARFGGTAYVFLRALPAGGLVLARPSWDELRSWEADLARELR